MQNYLSTVLHCFQTIREKLRKFLTNQQRIHEVEATHITEKGKLRKFLNNQQRIHEVEATPVRHRGATNVPHTTISKTRRGKARTAFHTIRSLRESETTTWKNFKRK